MNRMRAVSLLTAGLILTACTSGGDNTGTEPSAIPTPSAEAAGTLTIWLMDRQQSKTAVNDVNSRFKDAYPNVDVEVELHEWAGFQDKLTAALSSDSAPDVVEIGNSLTAKYADAGALADLTAETEAFGIDGMLPGLIPSGEWLHARYGIPFYGGVTLVVYRKDQFEKAGIGKPPTSLDELVEAAGELAKDNADNSKYSAFYFPGKYWHGALPFVWAHGGEIATQDGDAWRGALSSAESQAGLTQLKGLVEEYSKAPKDADETKNVDAFKTGNVGMMIDSWWVPGAVDTGELKGKVGAFALPGVEAGTTAPVFAGGSDLAVSAKSRNLGLAVEWTKLMTGLEAQTQLAKEDGVIPNQAGAFAGHEGNAFLLTADQAATNSRFTPVSPLWPNVESAQILPDMLVRIFTDEASVDVATTTASDEIAAVLNGQ